MKNILPFLLCYIITLTQNLTAQDFLEVKYSINDINRQRDNFRSKKIKSVTVVTGYGESECVIDEEGKIISMKNKSSGLIDVSYIYDVRGNLITVNYRLAPDEYEYDKNGNVIKKSGEENTVVCTYDSQNKLIKENVESDFESCSFEKIVYNELLMSEIIYPCCEGNYSMRHVYEYSDSGQLLKIVYYQKDCSIGIEKLANKEEYFYNENSKLPFKMIKDNQETDFIYEYYE